MSNYSAASFFADFPPKYCKGMNCPCIKWSSLICLVIISKRKRTIIIKIGWKYFIWSRLGRRLKSSRCQSPRLINSDWRSWNYLQTWLNSRLNEGRLMGRRAMHACHVSMRPIISSPGSSWGLEFIFRWLYYKAWIVFLVRGEDVLLTLSIMPSDRDVFGGF